MNIITEFNLPAVKADFSQFSSPGCELALRIQSLQCPVSEFFGISESPIGDQDTPVSTSLDIEVSSASDLIKLLGTVAVAEQQKIRICTDVFTWDVALALSHWRHPLPIQLDFSGIGRHIVDESVAVLVDFSFCKAFAISGLRISKAHCTVIKLANCEEFRIEYCVVHDCSAAAIQIGSGCRKGHIVHNYLTLMQRAAIQLCGDVEMVHVADNRIEQVQGLALPDAAIYVSHHEIAKLHDRLDNADNASYSKLKPPHDLYIHNNQILNCKGNAIVIEGGVNITIKQNEIRRIGMHSIACLSGGIACKLVENGISDAGWGNSNEQTSVNSTVEREFASILLDDSAYCSVLFNHIMRVPGGVQLASHCHSCLIGLNVIYSPEANTAMASSGISIGYDENQSSDKRHPCHHNTLFSNNIRGGFGSGIFIGKDCSHHHLFDNSIFQVCTWSLEAVDADQEIRLKNISLNNLSNIQTKNIPISKGMKLLTPRTVTDMP